MVSTPALAEAERAAQVKRQRQVRPVYQILLVLAALEQTHTQLGLPQHQLVLVAFMLVVAVVAQVMTTVAV